MQKCKNNVFTDEEKLALFCKLLRSKSWLHAYEPVWETIKEEEDEVERKILSLFE